MPLTKTACMVVQNFYDSDIRVRRKAEALVAAGYEVVVFALKGPSHQKTYMLEGVEVHTFALGKKRGSLLRYALEYFTFLMWSLACVTFYMRKRRFAFIDINTLPDFLVFCAFPARYMGAAVILDMHEISPEFYMSKYGVSEKSALVVLLKFIERLSLNFADRVITINEPIRDLLCSRGLARSKCTVITNSADEKRYVPAEMSEGGEAVADPEAFVMMYHGTLTHIYGMDIAVEAFGMVSDQMPKAQLWILGDGPDANLLHSLVQKLCIGSKVRFVGRIAQDEIPAWLNRCDVGVLPLRSDVFMEYASPNKLPEFIVMGKAVIVSRLAAIRRCFSEDALAYFEPNSPADLAKQMVRLYGDSALRNKLAIRAREEYAPIRWRVMKERYLKLMEEVVGGTIESRSIEPFEEQSKSPCSAMSGDQRNEGQVKTSRIGG